jgi:hypothetical protein
MTLAGINISLIPFIGSIILAISMPLIMISIREIVRQNRKQLIDNFLSNSGLSPQIPAVKFVEDRYSSTDKGYESWKLFLSSVPLVILCFFGLYVSFAPMRNLVAPTVCYEAEGATTTATTPGETNSDAGKASSSAANARCDALISPNFLTGGIRELDLAQPNTTPSSGSQNTTAAANTKQSQITFGHAITVIAYAFMGSFTFCLAYLLRAVANFELGPLSFLRATTQIVLAVLSALVLWRTWQTLPELAASWGGVGAAVGAVGGGVLGARMNKGDAPVADVSTTAGASATGAGAAGGGVLGGAAGAAAGTVAGTVGHGLGMTAGPENFSATWIAISFLIGFFPDLGLRYLSSRFPLFMKRQRDDLLKASGGISTEIIEGIDFSKRIRLEENNINDVQNLATANPIMLYVETPFTFMECFDWIAQAQLCALVGGDRFIELRRRNIRTVFDLRNAVLDNPPPQLLDVIAGVLFARVKDDHDLVAPLPNHQNTTPEAAQNTTAGAATQPDTARPSTAQNITTGTALNPLDHNSLVHLVRVITDNPHFRRLNQIRYEIVKDLPGTE